MPATRQNPSSPIVLYAPTWRGHVEETFFHSLPVGEKIVRSLLDRGATVIFRPHPFSYGFPEDAELIRNIQELLSEDAQRTARKHLWGAEAESVRGVIECMNASDAMVSDVSSVVSDYLYSGKPFAMVSVNDSDDEFTAQYPIASASYVLARDAGNLNEVLDAMLGTDPLAATRRDLRSDYLGEFPADGYADVFVRAAREVVETGRRKSQPSTETSISELGVAVEPADGGDEASTGPAGVRQRLLAAGRELVPAAGAVFTYCLLLLGGPDWLVAAAGLATVAVQLLFHRRAARRRRALNAMLGNGVATRALLALALVLLLGNERGLECRYRLVVCRPSRLVGRHCPRA